MFGGSQDKQKENQISTEEKNRRFLRPKVLLFLSPKIKKTAKKLQNRKNVRERVEFGTYVRDIICPQEKRNGKIKFIDRHNTYQGKFIFPQNKKGEIKMGIFAVAFALLPILAVNEMRQSGSYVKETKRRKRR